MQLTNIITEFWFAGIQGPTLELLTLLISALSP